MNVSNPVMWKLIDTKQSVVKTFSKNASTKYTQYYQSLEQDLNPYFQKHVEVELSLLAG